MVELNQQDNRGYQLGFSGDMLNTVIYLSRFGGASDYITVLGDDPFSIDMIKQSQPRTTKFTGKVYSAILKYTFM